MIELHKILSKIGCCSSCILRYMGSKNAAFYECSSASCEKLGLIKEDPSVLEHNSDEETSDEPAAKRRKKTPCICCLGLLQEDIWEDIIQKIRIALQESRYENDKFACALTSPISILIREHSINLYLMNELPKWKPDCVTPLKEAWKWSFGVKLAKALNKELDSGAVCNLLIKTNMTYKEENKELETLRSMSPAVFAEREKSFRKFHGELFTKRGVEGILSNVDEDTFKLHYRCPPDSPSFWADASSVDCSHSPIYIAGRYCKYSRELSQTPWILNGKRMMESSIQDIIFEPISKLYKMPVEDVSTKLKFISSGREDVDVRCIGDGRPFVVEIQEPKGVSLDRETLSNLAREMGEDKTKIQIRDLQLVSKDELSILKMGEETKTKTYIALCVKLEKGETNESIDDKTSNGDSASNVTKEDIDRLNAFSNISQDGKILIKQKTPLRVLHRRPLLIRDRTIHQLNAALIQEYPNLFAVEMTTQAGTYIKEFVHGDFGRTKPCLSDILGYKVDILALDVKAINLDWPKKLEDDSMQL